MKRRRGPVYRDAKVHVRRTMCKTCIFRSGNVMLLRPGVRDAMVAEATEKQAAIPCHETLGGLQSVCAGFFKRTHTAPLVIADKMEMIEWTK